MATHLPVIGGHAEGFTATSRTDGWWQGPAITFADPNAVGGVDAGWFGTIPTWMPHWIPGWASPAIYILIFPGAFRFTCYYYRKAYYRSFAGSPPGCAVGPLARGKKYRGETALLVFQNLHRFAMYFALLF